jgi:hypothetical protein
MQVFWKLCIRAPEYIPLLLQALDCYATDHLPTLTATGLKTPRT